MKNRYDFKPLQGVGPFKFGSKLKMYQHLNLKESFDEYNSKVDWRVFKMEKPDSRIYFENNQITSIACYEEIYYKGHNLIGTSFDELKVIINRVPDEQSSLEIENGIQNIYEFDDLAIQVWVKDDVVVSIFCSCEYEK